MAVFDVPSDARRSQIELTGGPASYVQEGPPDGAPLVLIHGLPGSMRDFRWLTPGLRTLRTIRVEMPGFGETPLATQPDASVLARAGFIVEFCDALGLRRPTLLGHSMGGVVGTAAVTLAPQRFAGLALVASPGSRTHRGFRQFPQRELISRLLRIPGAPRLMRKKLREAFTRAGFRHATDAELVHTIHCVAATPITEHARRLRDVAVPALHAFCDDDPLVEAEIAAETAELLGGPVHRFADGGHNPQKHHAVELAEALVRWLAEVHPGDDIAPR